jgi:predicted PurR-regulated permease PerM
MIYILSIVIVGTIGFLIRTNTTLKKQISELHQNQVTVNEYLRNDIRKIKVNFEEVHELITSNEIKINTSTKIQIDKLTTQIIKSVEKVRSDIPVTNKELELRVAEVEKQSHTMRMSM